MSDGKKNRNNIETDNFSEIDIVKSYQCLKKEKVEDFYGVNRNEIDPFAEWLLKQMFQDLFLIKYLYELVPDGEYDEMIIKAKKKVFITLKKKIKL